MLCLLGCQANKGDISSANISYFVVSERVSPKSTQTFKLCSIEDGMKKTLAALEGEFDAAECRVYETKDFVYVVLSSYGIAGIQGFNKSEQRMQNYRQEGLIKYSDVCGQAEDGLACECVVFIRGQIDLQKQMIAVYKGGKVNFVECPNDVSLIGSLQNRALLYRSASNKSKFYVAEKLPETVDGKAELHLRELSLKKNLSIYQIENNPLEISNE